MFSFENPNFRINEEKINELKKEVGDTTIVAATKYIIPEVMQDLYNAGINNFAESRTDAIIRKHFILRDYNITWHFIGHLQRNKAKDIINDIDYLHSLDSLELCKIIDKYRTKPLNCFLEIKLISSSNKTGISIDDIDSFLYEASKYPNVNIIGLMAMSEPDMTDEEIKELYSKVISVGKEHNLNNFSLGMSDDYKIALECGSTHVRLGRILYKEV